MVRHITLRPRPTPGCKHCPKSYPFACADCTHIAAGLPEKSDHRKEVAAQNKAWRDRQ